MRIDKQIKKINMMSPGIKRDLEIQYFQHYLLFLLDSQTIDAIAYNAYMNQVIPKAYTKHIPGIDVDNSLCALSFLFDVALTNASKYELFNLKWPNVDFNKYLQYVKGFFDLIDPEVCKLFCEMVDKDLITLVAKIKTRPLGGETCTIGNGKSSIVIEYNKSFYSILALVHEMGHAYHNYLSKCFPTYKDNFIDTECISMTFEFLFLTFLRDNHLINSDILDVLERNNLVAELCTMNDAYVYNSIISDSNIRDYSILNKIEVERIKEIYSKYTIIKNSFILRNRKKNLTFYDNFYGYGLLFAIMVRKMFINDKKEAIKLIKRFPSYANEHSGYELIETFNDHSYINPFIEYTDKILSKTHYKK